MAIEKLPVASSLRMALQTGVDENSDPIFVNRNYNRLKPTATDAGTYLVAEQLASLQIFPLAWVYRNDQAQLVDVV